MKKGTKSRVECYEAIAARKSQTAERNQVVQRENICMQPHTHACNFILVRCMLTKRWDYVHSQCVGTMLSDNTV